MKDSTKYYTEISQKYRAISEQRMLYLERVDQLIIENVSNGIDMYLDVGAGDGFRSKIIANGINAGNLFLMDNCVDMFQSENIDSSTTLIEADIRNFKSELKFDLITCLWNVLGHVGNDEDRKSSLRSMAKLLKPKGKLILDVNNRYNKEEYGSWSVLKNRIQSILSPKNAGYYPLGSGENATQVYIHKPNEIDQFANQIGLKVIAKKYINYSTGEIEKSASKGQLFYIFEKV